MTLDERARKIKDYSLLCNHSSGQNCTCIGWISDELRAVQEEAYNGEGKSDFWAKAYNEGYSKGLEKAADIVEQEEAIFDVTGSRMKEIAQSIRKLAEPNP